MKISIIGKILLLACAVIAPFMLQNYWLHVLIIGLYYAMLASSWSMLAGQVGIISFAHTAFAAVGAYTSALLVIHTGIGIGMGMAAGAIMAGFFGLGIGVLTLRMRGPYLALTTLGFSEIFRIFLTAEYGLTRGSYGLQVPIIAGGDKIVTYFIALAMLLSILGILTWITRSRWGLFLRSMREDEDGASARGVNVVKYKILTFVITSAMAGLAGAFNGHVVSIASPRIATIPEMGLILAMSVFGGVETFIGSCLGALVLQTLAEYLRDYTEWRLAIFSGIVLLTLRFAPEGLLPRAMFLFQRRKGYKLAQRLKEASHAHGE